MTLKEFYDNLGGQYSEICNRIPSDELIKKFLTQFLQDDTACALESALSGKQYEEAFRAAHTLKGVCMNLSLTPLLTVTDQLTDSLRTGKPSDHTAALFELAKEEYERTVGLIRRFLAPDPCACEPRGCTKD